MKKRMVKKSTFPANFGDFWSSDVDFQQVLVPKQVPGDYFFGVFFENGDFVKIVLPPWREHNFQGSDPPKNDPEGDSERHRQEKTTKIASGAVSGRTFSLPGPFFVNFGLPAGIQN